VRTLSSVRSQLVARLKNDGNWQALQQIADREAQTGAADRASMAAERGRLEALLSDNRNYAAWRKLSDVIDLLSSTADKPAPPPQAELPPPLFALPDDPADPSPPAPQADDLSRIRGINHETASRLAGQGITTFEQLASLSAKDIERLRTALDLGRRVSPEGWAKQAKQFLDRGRSASNPAGGAAVPAERPLSSALMDAVSMTKPLAAQANSAPAPAGLPERGPVLGARRSLLAAIEAAQLARTPQSQDTPETPAARTVPPPLPAQRPAEPATPPEVKSGPAVAATEPSAAATPLPKPSEWHPLSQAKPLLAPMEEEAEVRIVLRRSGEPLPPPEQDLANFGAPDAPPPLPVEAPKGPPGAYLSGDSRPEASVQIVVRQPAPAASSGSGVLRQGSDRS